MFLSFPIKSRDEIHTFRTEKGSKKYRVIQESERILKMNNSKTNEDKKMRFAPNGWEISQVLCGNKKVLLETNRWRCRISDIG